MHFLVSPTTQTLYRADAIAAHLISWLRPRGRWSHRLRTHKSEKVEHTQYGVQHQFLKLLFRTARHRLPQRRAAASPSPSSAASSGNSSWPSCSRAQKAMTDPTAPTALFSLFFSAKTKKHGTSPLGTSVVVRARSARAQTSCSIPCLCPRGLWTRRLSTSGTCTSAECAAVHSPAQSVCYGCYRYSSASAPQGYQLANSMPRRRQDQRR